MRSVEYDGTPGFCDHCWTVSDLLKLWPEEQTAGCECKCHIKNVTEGVKKTKRRRL